MPVLPSGRFVGIMSDRARYHAARKKVRVKAGTPHAQLYPLIDILIEHPRGATGAAKRLGFCGHTLGDGHWLRKWDERDRRFFCAWIREAPQKRIIEQARRRLIAEDEMPKERVFPYPERLYSPLRQRIAKLRLKRARPAQWRRTLLNLKQDGVRREELDWSGIFDFLQQLPEDMAVDKAVVAGALDYTAIRPRLSNELKCDRGCRLQVREVAQKIASYQLQMAGCPVGDRDVGVVRLVSDAPAYRIGVVWPQGRALLGPEPARWFALAPYGQAIAHGEGPARTLFNSREAALEAANQSALRNHRLKCDLTDNALYDHMTLHGGEAYREWLVTLPQFHHTHFNGHFNERNVLSHIRTKIRQSREGERVLFIEELQSDWHQAAVRPGSRGAVPLAPYRNEWAALALKLMLIHVVDSGLDGLAWADADIHEQRYNKVMMPLRRLYNDEMTAIFNELAKPWHGKVACATFETRSPWLHAVRGKKAWSVEGGTGAFSTRARYSKDEAIALIQRHSKIVSLSLPVFRVPDAMLRHIAEHGLPLFGTKTSHPPHPVPICQDTAPS